jgi:hypothetical protein
VPDVLDAHPLDEAAGPLPLPLLLLPLLQPATTAAVTLARNSTVKRLARE